MCKEVKHFKPYLLKNNCIVVVPHPAIQSFLLQEEMGERHVNWRTSLKEYDFDINPVHTVKGHGLYRLAAEVVHAHEEKEELTNWEQEIVMYDVQREPPT